MHRHAGRRSMILMGATVFVFATTPSPELQAQTSAHAGEDRPWGLMASIALTRGGPAGDMEEMLRTAGWDSDVLGTYPRTSSNGLSWALSLRRSLTPSLEVELMASRADTGWTSGSRPFFEYLSLTHSVTTMAPILSLRHGVWHLGAGPSVNRVSVNRTDIGNEESSRQWKAGALVDAGFTVPVRKSRLFLEGRSQYRWIWGGEVGPFAAPSGVPTTEIDVSHAFYSLGLGTRF